MYKYLNKDKSPLYYALAFVCYVPEIAGASIGTWAGIASGESVLTILLMGFLGAIFGMTAKLLVAATVWLMYISVRSFQGWRKKKAAKMEGYYMIEHSDLFHDTVSLHKINETISVLEKCHDIESTHLLRDLRKLEELQILRDKYESQS